MLQANYSHECTNEHEDIMLQIARSYYKRRCKKNIISSEECRAEQPVRSLSPLDSARGDKYVRSSRQLSGGVETLSKGYKGVAGSYMLFLSM